MGIVDDGGLIALGIAAAMLVYTAYLHRRLRRRLQLLDLDREPLDAEDALTMLCAYIATLAKRLDDDSFMREALVAVGRSLASKGVTRPD